MSMDAMARHWKMLTLEDVAAPIPNAIVDGPFGSNLKLDDYVPEGVPVLQGKNITDDTFRWFDVRFISRRKADELKRSGVRVGDILIVKIGSIGYSAIIDDLHGFDHAIIPANLAKVTPDLTKVDLRYLHRWLTSTAAKQYFIRVASKTAQPALSLGKIKGLPVPLPPLPEQRRIADILDKADALRAKRRAALSQLDTLTQSIFLDMFGRPIGGESTWRSKPLGEACEKITDGTHHSPPIQSEGIPYVTAKHLKKKGLDFFSDPWFVSENDHRAIFSRCDPRPGDVLYIKDGATTGIAAVNAYDFEFSMLSSLALLRPKAGVLTADFLCHWLNNALVKRWILGGMAGAAIRRLTLAKIKAIPLPLPPLQQQEEFVRRVARANRLRVSHQAALSEHESLFASLQNRAFRGEL